jgi:hypothetical protein
VGGQGRRRPERDLGVVGERAQRGALFGEGALEVACELELLGGIEAVVGELQLDQTPQLG